MIILKSFFRNKNTKIYFVLFLFIFSVIGLLTITKNNYIKIINSKYVDQYIWFKSPDFAISKLQKNFNVKNITEAITDNHSLYYPNKALKDNEIYLSEYFHDTYSIGDEFTITILNQKYTFKVIGLTKSLVYYISHDTYSKLKNDSNKAYAFTLKDWTKKEKTIENLQKDFAISLNSFEVDNIEELENNIQTINIFITIIIILFLILSIVTISNIYIEEKSTSRLYQVLGYTKKVIRVLFLFKVLLLIISSLTVSIILKLIIF